MLSFERFTPGDGPIYQQIVLYIKREISAGTAVTDDEIPSRRVLSALLGVNPNTVQKAYKILEDEKIIQSHSGAKSLIVADEKMREKIRTELTETDAKSVVTTLKQMGISKDEAFALIEKFWNEED
ncbi:MAG: GntR family transcriptional regulator [Ruminococcaceae bacterium]|nr:GntR family transcriptional regulator [Oscillospiraceae bacterium]MBQ9913151.1 GntR family transcriptional regulator [Clostridia bacterium]